LAVGVDQVGQGLGPFADQKSPPSQEIASLSHTFGVDVGLRQHAAPQEEGNLVGIDGIGLGLAAVDGFHVQGVSQHEGNLLLSAEVGQPVQAEHTRAGDHQAVAEGFDRGKEGLGTGGEGLLESGVALGIEDM
jgi:hypothetical protein